MSTKTNPMPMQTDPTAPIAFGVSLYRNMLTRYPIKTIEKPSIDRFPDFLVKKRLAMFAKDAIARGSATLNNTYNCSPKDSGVGLGLINKPIELNTMRRIPR